MACTPLSHALWICRCRQAGRQAGHQYHRISKANQSSCTACTPIVPLFSITKKLFRCKSLAVHLYHATEKKERSSQTMLRKSHTHTHSPQRYRLLWKAKYQHHAVRFYRSSWKEGSRCMVKKKKKKKAHRLVMQRHACIWKSCLPARPAPEAGKTRELADADGLGKLKKDVAWAASTWTHLLSWPPLTI